jgi:hypothetical protein
MKNAKLYKSLFIVALLVLGGCIVFYYWSVDTLEAIKFVPVYIMVLCLVYVLLQILKRYLFKSHKWWDWLYYIGLLSVMIPGYMVTSENLSTFAMMSDYGTLFLLIPALFDGIDLTQKK